MTFVKTTRGGKTTVQQRPELRARRLEGREERMRRGSFVRAKEARDLNDDNRLNSSNIIKFSKSKKRRPFTAILVQVCHN